MKFIKIFLISSFVLNFSCEKSSSNINIIKNSDLVFEEIEIFDTKAYEGNLLGVHWDRNEAYIYTPPVEKKAHTISVVDFEQDKIIKSLDLQVGTMESPTDVFSPSYMTYLETRYYLIDQYFKILIFDQNLSYLHTIMLRDQMYRCFVDFFSQDRDIFFLIGKKQFGPKESRCSIESYKITNTKINRDKTIYETAHKSNNYTRRTRNITRGELWSSSWGFEKEGSIYFCNGAENQYFVYDYEKDKLTGFKPEILKGMKFTDDEAYKLVFDIYQSGDTYASLKSNYKFISYPGILYYTGFYDIGKNKLGFAAELDLERMAFRLDIINLKSNEYEESIWLPVSHSLLRHLDENYAGLFDTYINIDKNSYIFTDYDPGEEMFTAKVLRFRILEE